MSAPPPPRLVVLQPGGLGDVVLASTLVARLRRARPGATVVLACRAAFAPLVPLMPEPPDAVVPIGLDPYLGASPSPELLAGLEALRAPLSAAPVDVLVDASLRPTWLGWVAAALARPARALRATRAADPGPALDRLLDRLGLARPAVERLEPADGLHELGRYALLAGSLGAGAAADDLFPWPARTLVEAEARAALALRDLPPGGYLACFPAGTAATAIKRWPASAFAEALRLAWERWRLPVLLLGTEGERAELEGLEAALRATEVPVSVFRGAPSDLPLLGGLLALARVTLGNDTGPAHLAAAFGVPGVTLFGGGGEWPAYSPWSAGTIGLHAPLPCTGCGWDCCLGHGLCVESIGVPDVLRALEDVLADPARPPERRAVALPSRPELELIAAASARHRAVETDRIHRLDVIEELTRALEQREGREAYLRELERAAAERLRLLEEVHAAAAERGRVIHELTAALAARDARIAALEGRPLDARAPAPAPPVAPRSVRAFQISTGLGAGNVGDELMARAFWDRLPPHVTLDVPLFPEAARQHEPYPARHRTLPVVWDGDEAAAGPPLPGLLVGGTPVADAEGLVFPLRFLAPRLGRFHRLGLPVDAVGVGVDRLRDAEAAALFRDAFLPIRSWTVRSEACREALLELGVPPARVRVGADWAFAYRPRRDLRSWAAELWRRLGVDPERPLVVVNVVNMLWRGARAAREAIAAALERARERLGLQIAFTCNECRPGEFYDAAAAREVGALLRAPAVHVPADYFSPDEALALLSFASAAVGQRYHILVQAVLAGVVPVSLERGQKMRVLAAELGVPVGGTVESVDRDVLLAAIEEAVTGRDRLWPRVEAARERLRARAETNLDLVLSLPPYADGGT